MTEIKPYITVDYDLLKADGFVNKETGEFVKLIANDKLLYSYLKARIKYFVIERRGEYYDTQESIANACGMNVTSARKGLAKFRDNGILEAKLQPFKNYNNWRYSRLHNLELWIGTTGKEKMVELTTNVNVKEKPYNFDFDEEGLPF